MLLRHIPPHSESSPYRNVAFYCPGCKLEHPYRIVAEGHTEEEVRKDFPNGCWTWNGSEEKPSFTPSLLCNQSYPEHRCHLFVTDGQIHYCGDCHHDLKGQTVPMVPVELDP